MHKHVHELLNKNILIKREVGPSHECYLNLEAEPCRLAVSLSSYSNPSRHSKLADSLRRNLPKGTIAFLEKDIIHIISEDVKSARMRMKAVGSGKKVIFHTFTSYFSSEFSYSMPTLLFGSYYYLTRLSDMTMKVVMQR